MLVPFGGLGDGLNTRFSHSPPPHPLPPRGEGGPFLPPPPTLSPPGGGGGPPPPLFPTPHRGAPPPPNEEGFAPTISPCRSSRSGGSSGREGPASVACLPTGSRPTSSTPTSSTRSPAGSSFPRRRWRPRTSSPARCWPACWSRWARRAPSL